MFDVRLKIGLCNRKGTMRQKIVLITFVFWVNSLFSQELTLEKLPYKKNIKEKILAGEIFSESTVTSFNSNKEQKLAFSIAGLHPKSCTYALKTLSLYEEYSQFLSFVKSSSYSDSNNEIDFLLAHAFLPYQMRLIFKLPRITKVGTYPYSFEIGILKNLTGNIYVSDRGKQCLFYTTANWSGPHTGFNNTIFEFFSRALAKLSMESLFRISSSLSH